MGLFWPDASVWCDVKISFIHSLYCIDDANTAVFTWPKCNTLVQVQSRYTLYGDVTDTHIVSVIVTTLGISREQQKEGVCRCDHKSLKPNAMPGKVAYSLVRSLRTWLLFDILCGLQLVSSVRRLALLQRAMHVQLSSLLLARPLLSR